MPAQATTTTTSTAHWCDLKKHLKHTKWKKQRELPTSAQPLIFRPIAPIREARQMKKRTVRLFLEALLLIHPEADATKSFPRDVCPPSCFLAMPSHLCRLNLTSLGDFPDRAPGIPMPLCVALLRIHQIRADLEQGDGYCWGSRKDQRRIAASAARHCQFRGRRRRLLAMHWQG